MQDEIKNIQRVHNSDMVVYIELVCVNHDLPPLYCLLSLSEILKNCKNQLKSKLNRTNRAQHSLLSGNVYIQLLPSFIDSKPGMF